MWILLLLILAMPAWAIDGTPTTREESLTVSGTAVAITACTGGESALVQVKTNSVYFTFRGNVDPDSNDFLGEAGTIIEVDRPLLFKAIAVTDDAQLKVQCFEK